MSRCTRCSTTLSASTRARPATLRCASNTTQPSLHWGFDLKSATISISSLCRHSTPLTFQLSAPMPSACLPSTGARLSITITSSCFSSTMYSSSSGALTLWQPWARSHCQGPSPRTTGPLKSPRTFPPSPFSPRWDGPSGEKRKFCTLIYLCWSGSGCGGLTLTVRLCFLLLPPDTTRALWRSARSSCHWCRWSGSFWNTWITSWKVRSFKKIPGLHTFLTHWSGTVFKYL